MTIEIRKTPFRADLFGALVEEGANGDGTFLLRLRDQWATGVLRFDRPGEVLLGAFAGESLVGAGGISLDPYAQDSDLCRLRHVYVLKDWRKRGIAALLVERLVTHARPNFATVRLRTQNREAARLYERLGFAPSARDDETHRMALNPARSPA